jgi:hypothetical protein
VGRVREHLTFALRHHRARIMLVITDVGGLFGCRDSADICNDKVVGASATFSRITFTEISLGSR